MKRLTYTVLGTANKKNSKENFIAMCDWVYWRLFVVDYNEDRNKN